MLPPEGSRMDTSIGEGGRALPTVPVALVPGS